MDRLIAVVSEKEAQRLGKLALVMCYAVECPDRIITGILEPVGMR